MKYIVIYVAIINVLSFLLFGIDKYKAKKNKRRVSERTLLVSAAAGGSLGAFAGMRMFHHKTQKKKFSIGIPVIIILQIIVLIYVGIKF